MKTISTILMICIAIASQAQSIDKSVIANAGDTNSNTSNSINFTIGETIVGTISNSSSIDQGFWSGIGLSNALSTEEIIVDNTTLAIYPNPVSTSFTIRIPDIDNYTFSLFNSSGQKVVSQKVTAAPLGNRIDISSLAQGVYMLSLSIPETNKTETFKIIKQ